MHNLTRAENPSANVILGHSTHGKHYRLYDATSLSPHIPGIGFEATHPLFKGMTKRAWIRDIQPDLHLKTTHIGRDAKRGMVRHITGGWAGYNARARLSLERPQTVQTRGMTTRSASTASISAQAPELPQPESEWISATASFDWMFYELARRLARKESRTNKSGEMEDMYKVSEVHVALIRPPRYKPAYKGARMALVSDVGLWLGETRTSGDHVDERGEDVRKLYDAAISFSRASGEQLYYGKVFHEDIVTIVASDRKVRSTILLLASADEMAGVIPRFGKPAQGM